MRFGSKGAISLEIAGSRAGLWFDHSAGTGGDLLEAIKQREGGSFPDALKAAVELLGGGWERQSAPVPLAFGASDSDARRQKNIVNARRIFDESLPPAGTPVEKYLLRRELQLVDNPDLRFHPNCPRFQSDPCPAMVWAMRQIRTGEFCGIHRTYITSDGFKAERHSQDKCKEMLGPSGGAAVMLDPFEDVTYGLFISEGVEDGLHVRLKGWMPMWATGSAQGIKGFPVLAGVECLTIMSDADKAGREAAFECGKRWQAAGREVWIAEPRIEGSDWNDALKGAAT